MAFQPPASRARFASNATIYDAKVAAGEAVNIEGDSVSIIGAQEKDAFSSTSKKSGLFAGSGGGFFSLWGKESKAKDATETQNVGAELSAGTDVNIKARESDVKLDDTRQEVRATVGEGEITIRDKDKQAELEAEGKTEDLAALNRDPDKAYEITRDEHVDVEFYFSDTSVKAAIAAGAAVTEIIGGALDHIREPELSQAIRNYEIDPATALQQLRSGACGEQRGGAGFDLWEWIVPTAHAADCTLTTLSGKPIVIHDREGCFEALTLALYNQTVGASGNLESFSRGIAKGVASQGEEFAALVSDPAGMAKTISGVAMEIAYDPVAAAAKYGYAAADGLSEQSLLYLQALANGNYEAAGEYLSGLAIDLAIKVAAPAAGTAIGAIKTADKLAALKKIEKIEKAATKAGVPNGVSFGRNANQDYHVWRHVEDELGMSRQRVQDAVVADLPPAGNLSSGLNVRFVTIDGVRLQYNAFKLPDGTINIGRIHEAN